jgi:ATP-binding cassette, subfamily B, multidrug efflux pump
MLLRLLIQFLRPYRRQLAVVIALQLAATTAMVYLPNLYARIIDRGVATGEIGYILTTGAIMLAISLAQVACSIAATFYGARVSMAFGRDLRRAVFHRVGELSAHDVAGLGAPSLITRTTNDVQQVQMVALLGATMLIAAPLMCIGGVVMALREDIVLSRLLLIAVPVLAGGIGGLIWRMMPHYHVMQQQIDAINRVLREQITGVRVVRAFVREAAEAARFDVTNRDLTQTALRVGRLQAAMFPIVILVFNVSQVAVLWFGGGRVAAGAMGVGQALAFLSYLMQILVAIMLVTFLSTMIPRAVVCARRITEVLETVPSVVPPAAPVVPSGVPGSLELRGVEYRYPGAEAPVLSGVSFTAEPGQLTAIVGSTGAGKTTLLELIPRLIDPTAGSVMIEGCDARSIALDQLWSRVGVVPQRPYLFSGTVASNLRYGNPDATDDELWAALEIAQARDFVTAMPRQLEAPIAQGGTNVSGGQRQRLSIARALLRKPSIYLFDDSFSALDLATESRLRAALKPHVAHATVIMVAQRVASIIEADQIIVLDDGGIVGRGRHTELLASCATYAEIVESQRAAEAA